MKIILLLLLMTLMSCSTYLRTMGPRMLSPESHGKFGSGAIDLARVQGHQTNKMDFSGNTTTESMQDHGVIHGGGVSGELGLVNRLDFFLFPSLAMSPTIYGLKVQVLGDSRPEAKQGNFSLSLLAGLGNREESRKDDDDDIDFLDGQIDEIDLETSHQDVGLIAGYRWTDYLIQYANALYYNEKVEGKVTNNAGTLVDAPFTYKNHGQIYSMGAILYAKRVQFKLDVTHLISNWSHTRKQSANMVSGGIGFVW